MSYLESLNQHRSLLFTFSASRNSEGTVYRTLETVADADGLSQVTLVLFILSGWYGAGDNRLQ